MLVAGDRDSHDPGEYLHAILQFLRYPNGTAHGARSRRARSGGGCRRRDEPAPLRHHKCRARRARAIRHRNPHTAIEVLVPDFKGNLQDVDTVLEARPDIFNHNVETVERLQKPVRVQARYDRSRSVLQHAKKRGFTTKTGLMLGLGELRAEVERTLRDLAGDQVDILTIGQYLRPTLSHLPVDRWVEPSEFQHWREFGLSIGFGVVESGALVRSSYHADEQSLKYTGEEHLNSYNRLAV
jgi:lipoic acid synthetase